MPPVRRDKKTQSTLNFNSPYSRPPGQPIVLCPTRQSTVPHTKAKSKNNVRSTISKGEKDVYFQSDRYKWEEEYQDKIGTSTRKITFGSDFVLTDKHIDQILALGSKICEKLTDFIFIYNDVSYDARNSAKGLTDAAVIRLAEACPNLKKVELPDASELTGNALLGFLQFCPKLTLLEISPGSKGKPTISGAVFDALREEQDWAPKLKKLILLKNDKPDFMKPMRELTRSRSGLVVRLMDRDEQKKWGDWELCETSENYKKGRKQSTW